jgi:hypothetical protein
MTAPQPTAPPAPGNSPHDPGGNLPDPTASGRRRWPVPPPWLAAPAVLASPEGTAETGMKFVGLIIGLTLIWAAIRAMFGRKR